MYTFCGSGISTGLRSDCLSRCHSVWVLSRETCMQGGLESSRSYLITSGSCFWFVAESLAGTPACGFPTWPGRPLNTGQRQVALERKPGLFAFKIQPEKLQSITSDTSYLSQQSQKPTQFLEEGK